VKKVTRSETEFVFLYRTQLFSPGNLDNVKKVQAGLEGGDAVGVPRDAGTQGCADHDFDDFDADLLLRARAA
jgi:hypothetical protein